MKPWEVEDVLRKVEEVEEEKGEYRRMALTWENMWRLKGFEKSAAEAQQEGYEQISTPTPYNTVNLTCRLIADDPKVDCPARDPSQVEIDISEKKERWLVAAWQLLGQQQRVNLVSNAKWQSAVRGLHAFEVKWIHDELPKTLKGKRFPILVRNLDPLNVGVKEGPLWTEYAYHRYEADPTDVQQRYPKYKKKQGYDDDRRGFKKKTTVVDFWYTDPDGAVWNCVVAEDEYIKKPQKTTYAFIPIVVGGADVSFSNRSSHRSLSILHPLMDIWPVENRLASMMLTNVRWYSDPHVMMQNEYGQELPNIDVKPGSTQQYPWGTKVEVLQFQPNTMLGQQMLEFNSKHIQESTFPGVMYGQAPGSLQAGYGVSILSNAAEGRVASIRYNLERSIERVNELMLSLVETEAPDAGVRVWGVTTGRKEFFYETLLPSDIDGYYENRVRLAHKIPQNDIAVQTLYLRLVESGILSKEWYRDNAITEDISPDEKEVILVEQLMENEEIKPKLMKAALARRFPDKWQEFLAGTSMDEQMQAQMQAQQQPPMDPNMMGGPPAMPPNGGPGMDGGGVPSPFGGPMMQPPTMPPIAQGAPPQQAMMPPLPGVGMPQVPLPMQPPSPNFDVGAIPPELAGQLTPEAMGQPGMDPLLFNMLMGRQVPPAEELGMIGRL